MRLRASCHRAHTLVDLGPEAITREHALSRHLCHSLVHRALSPELEANITCNISSRARLMSRTLARSGDFGFRPLLSSIWYVIPPLLIPPLARSLLVPQPGSPHASRVMYIPSTVPRRPNVCIAVEHKGSAFRRACSFRFLFLSSPHALCIANHHLLVSMRAFPSDLPIRLSSCCVRSASILPRPMIVPSLFLPSAPLTLCSGTLTTPALVSNRTSDEGLTERMYCTYVDTFDCNYNVGSFSVL